MKIVQTLGAFLLCLRQAVAVDVGRCVTASSATFTDVACDGSAAKPCQGQIKGMTIGDVVEVTLAMTAEEPADDAACKGVSSPKCEAYTKSIFITVVGTDPATGVDVELSPNGVKALCVDACVSAAGDPFSGICQVAGSLQVGCVEVAETATDLCAVPLVGKTSFARVSGTAQCEVDGTYNDEGSACTAEAPCEVKMTNTDFKTGTIVELVYTQDAIAEEEPENAYCASGSTRAAACEPYSKSIYAKVVAGEASGSEMELSPAGIRALCVGQCLDGADGAFSGVCQQAPASADGTECAFPAAETAVVCGVPLKGGVVAEAVATTAEPTSTSGASTLLASAAVSLVLFVA